MTNEIPVNIPPQFLVQEKHISKIPAFLDEIFDQLSINSRTEAAKFKPEPTFENTINDIKENNLKSITSIAMNPLAITSKKPSSSSENLKSNIMSWILLQSLGKSS